MTLTGAHYIYILFMVIVLVTMILKKDVIIPVYPRNILSRTVLYS